MEIIRSSSETDMLKENKIIGDPELVDSSVIFKGKDNILVCEEGVRIHNSKIMFGGDNAVIYLFSNNHLYYLKIDIYRESVIFFGKNNYFNSTFSIIASERKNVIIGEKSVFSFGIWLRTADPHLVYNNNTKKRTNVSKSIFLGDHLWIGQSALVLKGSRVGSGTIIGAMSVLTGKKLCSNAMYAGNPVKLKRQGIFFTGDCVHNYTCEMTKASMKKNTDRWIYSYVDKEMLDVTGLEQRLSECSTSDERIAILKKYLVNTIEKNRFYIENSEKKGTFHKIAHLFP